MTLFCLRAAGVHYPRMSWPAHAIALSGMLTCFATALVGCSSGHHQEVSIANLPPEPTPAQLSLPPPSAPQALAPKSLASQPSPPQPSKGPIRAAQIMKLLSGKSFTYTRAGGRKGTVMFNADGTFSYNETGKGEGTGIWQASEGKLCQALDPTNLMPKGTPSQCTPFTVDGGSYVAGDARFNPV